VILYNSMTIDNNDVCFKKTKRKNFEYVRSFFFCRGRVLTRFCTQGLVLTRQAFYHLSHTYNLFSFSYFLDRVLYFLPKAGLRP
jgi:hypothetical protein